MAKRQTARKQNLRHRALSVNTSLGNAQHSPSIFIFRNGKSQHWGVWLFVIVVVLLSFLVLFRNLVSDARGKAGEQITPVPTCAAQGGNYCTSDQQCDGQILDASDTGLTAFCCFGNCLPVSPSAPSAIQMDVDGNGILDQEDVRLIAQNRGTCLGDAGFQFQLDINRDNCITLSDVVILAKTYGS